MAIKIKYFIGLIFVLFLVFKFTTTWWYLTGGTSKYWYSYRYDDFEKMMVKSDLIYRFNWNCTMNTVFPLDSNNWVLGNTYKNNPLGIKKIFWSKKESVIIYQSEDSLIIANQVRPLHSLDVDFYSSDSINSKKSVLIWDLIYLVKTEKPESIVEGGSFDSSKFPPLP